MGWLFQHDPLAHETPADHFTREFTHESETTKATVLATATVHGTVYAAIRNPNKQTGYSYVFCAVILFKNSQRDGFGYKDIDETMGPCEVDCPDRIMRLLSPIEHIPNPGYAADWRARVCAAKANAARTRNTLNKMKVGHNVKLAIPAYFSKGRSPPTCSRCFPSTSAADLRCRRASLARLPAAQDDARRRHG